MLVGVFGVSFLTPLGGLFAVAAVVPLVALALTERRSARIRALLGVRGPGRGALLPVAVSLALVAALVGAAAAQPVVVRRQVVLERGDAQAWFVFDTSRSMLASAGPGTLTRLARAKRLARRLRAALGDVPVGIATWTDRVLPDLLPTTDPALFDRTLVQSVGIDEPPPSAVYRRHRATQFLALVPLTNSNFYSASAHHRLLVVFTDGEASAPAGTALGIEMENRLAPVFVHVWAAGERIYTRGRPDPYYLADPASVALLQGAAKSTNGTVFTEHQLGAIERQAHRITGYGRPTAHIDGYARVSLGGWFALAATIALAFLLWRRNA